MIRPTPLLAVCTALVFVASACGSDGQPVTIAAEALTASAESPSTSAPAAGDATQRAELDDAGAVAAAVPTTEAPVGDNPNWPPVTLAPGQPPVMPASVNVIGDSIALSAQPLMTAALESLGIEILTYDAVESRRMASNGPGRPSGVSAIEDALDDGAYPELWIIALGTNDVGAMSDPDEVSAHIGEILELVPVDAHLIWIDTWVRDVDDGAVEFNALVRDLLAARPYTMVIDWYARAATDGVIISDGVHLSDTGKVEYARLVGDTLRASFDRG